LLTNVATRVASCGFRTLRTHTAPADLHVAGGEVRAVADGLIRLLRGLSAEALPATTEDGSRTAAAATAATR
jgi:hypothetical protein